MLFCFDFSGSGKSQGPFCSLGWYEQEDVESVLHYLVSSQRVSKIALWGRSMGAATSIFYSRRDTRISCLILDSPFASFKQVVQELANKKASLPAFLTLAGFSLLRSSIISKADFDIELLEPTDYIDKIHIPALFGVGGQDSFISPDHTKQLHKQYKGKKDLIIFEGEHNTPRPSSFIIKATKFLAEQLIAKGEEEPLSPSSETPTSGSKTKENRIFDSPPATNRTSSCTGLPIRQLIGRQASMREQSSKRLDSSDKKPQTSKNKEPSKGLQPKFSWLEHSNSTPCLHIKKQHDDKQDAVEEVKDIKDSLTVQASDSIGTESLPQEPKMTFLKFNRPELEPHIRDRKRGYTAHKSTLNNSRRKTSLFACMDARTKATFNPCNRSIELESSSVTNSNATVITDFTKVIEANTQLPPKTAITKSSIAMKATQLSMQVAHVDLNKTEHNAPNRQEIRHPELARIAGQENLPTTMPYQSSNRTRAMSTNLSYQSPEYCNTDRINGERAQMTTVTTSSTFSRMNTNTDRDASSTFSTLESPSYGKTQTILFQTKDKYKSMTPTAGYVPGRYQSYYDHQNKEQGFSEQVAQYRNNFNHEPYTSEIAVEQLRNQ